MLDILTSIDITSLMQSTVRLAIPFILAAIGGLFSDTAGVSSIELEAVVLIGAFAAFAGAYFSGSLIVGLAFAMLAGMLLNLIYAYMVVIVGARAPLVATALMLLAIGFTNFFNRALFDVGMEITRVTSMQAVSIPLLRDIPFLGKVFFEHNLLGYFTFLLVLAQWFFLKKTALGLEWRSVGENPVAADTAGIPVRRYRMIGVLLTGVFAGLAGAYLSIAASNIFIERMSAEKGYAAFAIIILGKYAPGGVLLGCLLYGFADALQLNLQAMGADVPNQFLLMLPYLFTLIVLFVSGKGRIPQGHGKFFAPKSRRRC
ncbi:MAG: ABC transporter permease [Bacillota bacterium]